MARPWIERNWQDEAACRGPLAPAFYPPSHNERRTDRAAREARAKSICAGCHVRRACLDHALAEGERHGVWGGLSETERRDLVLLRRGA